MLAMFRIRDQTLSGKLVRFLTVLASTLAVALARDRSVATTRRTNLARSEYEIDVRQHVIDAVRVMFDAARVHHHPGLRSSIEPSRINDLLCGHTADLRSDIRRIPRYQLECCLPVVRACIDEGVIDEILFDQHIQHSIRERDVSSGLELKMQISLARSGCFAWIDDDPASAIVTLLPEKFVEHGEGLGTVGAGDQQDFS